MKKVLIVMCIVLCVMLGGTLAYADEVMPCYNEITEIQSTMTLDGNVLYYTVKVFTPAIDTLDSVHIDAQLKTVGGLTVATYSENLNKIGPAFMFNKNKTLTRTGTYFLDYTVTCYKNGNVVDEVSKTTVTATY